MFGVFTFTMFGTHARFILLNITTVEQMRNQDMKEHESAMLAERYSMCAFAKKRQVRARWDEEWGRPAFEGNIWWLGSGQENWESVMGRSVWLWFRESRDLVAPIPSLLTHPLCAKSRWARPSTMVWIIRSTRDLMTGVCGAGGQNGQQT